MNLVCGCLSMVYVFKGNIPFFAGLTGACLVFDFLDGFAARKLQAQSTIGKELDSLADMVSFGLVPGAILYHIFKGSVPLVIHYDEWWAKGLVFFPFIVTVFSALRLAKFNTDTTQTDSFKGLPTPSVTIFVTGIALILEYDRFHLTPIIMNSFNIAGLSMILSFLLVSDVRLVALKFKSAGWGTNRVQYGLVIMSILLLVSLQAAGIPLIIVLYIILSLINNKYPLNQPVKNN